MDKAGAALQDGLWKRGGLVVLGSLVGRAMLAAKARRRRQATERIKQPSVRALITVSC